MQQQRKPSLLEAIAAASSAFADVTKDSKNDYLKSQYLALPGLLKAIKQPLLEQGIVIYTQVALSNGCWLVRTTLSLVDGSEELSSEFPIPEPSNLQRIGAAITYGTRYNLFALLAVCPENDDDGNGGGYTPPATQAQALPGLPGAAPSPAAWPAHGQQVTAPVALYQQMPAPQMPAPAAMAFSVQPLPVLQ